MNRMKRVLAILGLVGSFGFLSVAPASAAMPPASYPTQRIMGYARDVTGHTYPVRFGFYDPVSNKGFGKDKIYSKHNITSMNAIRFVLRSPHLTYEGNDAKYTAYANKLKRNASHT